MSDMPHPEDPLLELAYGELDAPAAAAVQAHLETCPDCARKLADVRGIRRAMGALEAVPPPSQGVESLLGYARQSAARRPAPVARPSRPGRWLFAATALVTASIAVVVATAPSRRLPASEGAVAASAPVAVSPSLQAMPQAPEPEVEVPAKPRPDERLALRERSEKKASPEERERFPAARSRGRESGGAATAPPSAPAMALRQSGPKAAQRELPRQDALAFNDAPAPQGGASWPASPARAPSDDFDRAFAEPPPSAKAAVISPASPARAPASEPERLEALCHRTPPSALSPLSRTACRELLRRYPGSPSARAARAVLDAAPDAGAASPP